MPDASRRTDPLVQELASALNGHPAGLASAALTIAKLEYPGLDPRPHLQTLDRLGARARRQVDRRTPGSIRDRVEGLNRLLFEDEGFAGNRRHYDDFRNSLLNTVLDRRLGIPITLALVYMEVAHRAGMRVEGVAFPGHFLMRVALHDAGGDKALLLDPFDAGRELSVADCRDLLARGADAHDPPRFDRLLLQPCSPRRMVARMLHNLKRAYVDLRLYARARRATDLLLAVEPLLISELRIGDCCPTSSTTARRPCGISKTICA